MDEIKEIEVQGTPVRIDEKKQAIRRLPSGKMDSHTKKEIRARLWRENSVEQFRADHVAWLRTFPEESSLQVLHALRTAASERFGSMSKEGGTKRQVIRYFYDVSQMVTRDALRESAYALIESGVRLEIVRAAMLDFLVELAYKHAR